MSLMTTRGEIRMVRINKEDYKKMKLAMETKNFSVLKNLNLAKGVNELALRRVLKDNAYVGVSLEDTFESIQLVDGPTGLITQEEIDELMNSEDAQKFFEANGLQQNKERVSCLTINRNQEFILKNELGIAATLLNGLGSARKDYAQAMESIMKMPYYFVLVSGRDMKEFTVNLEDELSGLKKMPSDEFFDELLRKIFGDYTLV